MNTGKSEAQVTAEVLAELQSDRYGRYFRNQVGRGKTSSGRWIDFGLCPGSFDYVGIRSILITPQMVGTRIGQFTAIEMKRENGGVLSKEQHDFQKLITAFGGKTIVTNGDVKVLDLLST